MLLSALTGRRRGRLELIVQVSSSLFILQQLPVQQTADSSVLMRLNMSNVSVQDFTSVALLFLNLSYFSALGGRVTISHRTQKEVNANVQKVS